MSNLERTDGYEIVARYEDRGDADGAVERLVLGGLGAMIERESGVEAPFGLLVVEGEADRAREILGLPVADTPLRPPGRPPIFWIVLIFIAAMIILPVVAFFVSFKLSGG